MPKQRMNMLLNRILIEPISFIFPSMFIKSYQQSASNSKIMDFKNNFVITLSFDCDLLEDIEALPKILSLLSNYNFKASFACIGKWIEKYVDLHLRIINEGHEIINHTYSHPNNEVFNPHQKFNLLTYAERKDEIIRCHEVINRLLNYAPIGFRIPHFGNQFVNDIYDILLNLDYRYSSSTVALKSESFGSPYRALERIIEFPVSPCPKHPLTCFDSYHFFRSNHPIYRSSHRDKEDFLKCFNKLLGMAKQNYAYLNVYFDPLDLIENKGFTSILDSMVESGAAVLNYAEIVKKIDGVQKN